MFLQKLILSNLQRKTICLHTNSIIYPGTYNIFKFQAIKDYYITHIYDKIQLIFILYFLSLVNIITIQYVQIGIGASTAETERYSRKIQRSLLRQIVTTLRRFGVHAIINVGCIKFFTELRKLDLKAKEPIF